MVPLLTLLYLFHSSFPFAFLLLFSSLFDCLIQKQFISFEEKETNYTFGGQSTLFPQHTLKINFGVSLWPFKTITNSLDIVMDNNAEVINNNNVNNNECGGPVDGTVSNVDAVGNLLWMKTSLNGVASYLYYY